MIRLGARLSSDVFLWECMALNPKYVELLQHDWMRDDFVTLTNAIRITRTSRVPRGSTSPT